MIGGAANSENIKTPRMISESKKKDLESLYLSYDVLYLLFLVNTDAVASSSTEDEGRRRERGRLRQGAKQIPGQTQGYTLVSGANRLVGEHDLDAESPDEFLSLVGKSAVGDQHVDFS